MQARSVSILGTGLMGSAVARALVDHYPVTVWNRTRSKAESLASAGVAVAATATAAIEASDLILVHVNSCEDLRSVLTQARISLRGKTLFNLVTGSPSEIRALGAFIEALGGRFMTGVIMSFPEQVGTADGAILACGDETGWRVVEPIARLIGPNAKHLGTRVSDVHVLEMISIGCIFWPGIAAFLEGAAYARREGLAITDLAPFLPSVMGAIEREIGRAIGQIERGDYRAASVRISTLDDNFAVYRTALSDVGSPDDMLAAVHGKIKRAIAAGNASASVASLIDA